MPDSLLAASVRMRSSFVVAGSLTSSSRAVQSNDCSVQRCHQLLALQCNIPYFGDEQLRRTVLQRFAELQLVARVSCSAVTTGYVVFAAQLRGECIMSACY